MGDKKLNSAKLAAIFGNQDLTDEDIAVFKQSLLEPEKPQPAAQFQNILNAAEDALNPMPPEDNVPREYTPEEDAEYNENNYDVASSPLQDLFKKNLFTQQDIGDEDMQRMMPKGKMVPVPNYVPKAGDGPTPIPNATPDNWKNKMRLLKNSGK
jgi:hypothetical protein